MSDKLITNWFKMPNSIFSLELDAYQIAVVAYIARHTWGFQEYDTGKKITLDEFEHGRKYSDGSRMDNGVGISRSKLSTVLKTLVELNVLNLETDYSDLARKKHYYSIAIGETAPAENNAPIQDLRTMPYREYLQTDHWQVLRKRMLKRAGYRCQLCNVEGRLHVHHRTYENRGNESYSDLIVLCPNCHAKHHDKI